MDGNALNLRELLNAIEVVQVQWICGRFKYLLIKPELSQWLG